MHDLESMAADLMEAINDMPVAATILYKDGKRVTLSTCAVSDLRGADRLIEEEGIMIEADISVTYPLSLVKFDVTPGATFIVNRKSYRAVRVTRDRSNQVSETAECREVR